MLFVKGSLTITEVVAVPTMTVFVEHIYKTYIGETHYKPWLDFSQYAIIPRYHPLCAKSPSSKSHIYVFSRFSVAYSMYITPQNSF
jgi:hypothetical protein